MRSPPGLRLWVLNIALFLVAGGTIYGLYTAWHRVLQVEANLTTSQIERFQMASEVRRELQNLNNSMMRYVLVRDPLEWAQFDLASSNLNQWIDSNDPSMNPKSPLSTVAEGRVFEELNRDYDDYLNSASAIHSNAQPALASQAQLTELDAFNSQADHMRDLVRQLSDAHRAAEAEFLANATASLDSLRKILMLGVVLLLGLVATLGWVIYRDMIAPLRIKLV
ncbi:MAG TPA: hypothetical protein VH255_10305, partial [Verrucomicrobiae bacterium]|nr:hypothetical protein [Verrucomicrobiae bacterium]